MTVKKQLFANTLKEGMAFSEPVFFDDGHNMFLPAKSAMGTFHIEAINCWKITSFLTEGTPVDASTITLLNADETHAQELAPLELLDELEDEDVFDEAEQNRLLHEDYKSAITKLSQIFTAYKNKKTITKASCDEVVMLIYRIVNMNRHLALNFVFSNHENLFDYAVSAVNIAILSLLTALNFSVSHLAHKNLVAAALLHDIGMFNIPTHIIGKTEKLSSQEFELLKVHPIEAAKYVTNILLYPKEVGMIVLQHHERGNGTGYPKGLKQAEINDLSTILAITDSFEALISKKTYRDSLVAYEAIKMLIANKNREFNPTILKVFIRAVGIYPLGSLVLLSDNRIAKVKETKKSAPFSPIIETNDSSKTIIDLSRDKSVYIIRALTTSEIETLKRR